MSENSKLTAQQQTYIDKNDKPTTIGDVLRLQGVDISKFLSED